jgi:aldehyde dehydrogenase
MSRRLEVRRRSSGPVVPVTKFKTLDEAVAIGNDTVYGLAGVWSRNIDNCCRVGRAIKAGRLLDELLSCVSGGRSIRRLQEIRLRPRTHKQMLDRYQRTKNVLVPRLWASLTGRTGLPACPSAEPRP